MLGILLCPVTLFAETILLKNGTVIEGEILTQGRDSVTIKTPFGTQRISKDQIRRISHGQTDAAKKEEERRAAEQKEAQRKAEQLELERKAQEEKLKREQEEKAAEAERQDLLRQEASKRELEAARQEQEKSKMDAEKALLESRRREALEKEVPAQIQPATPAPPPSPAQSTDSQDELRKQEEEKAAAELAKQNKDRESAEAEEKKAREERLQLERAALLKMEKLREEKRQEEQAMLSVRYGSVLSAGFVSGVTRTLGEKRNEDLFFRRDLFLAGRWAEASSFNHRTSGGTLTYRYLRPFWMCFADFTAQSANPKVNRTLYGGLTDTGSDVFFPLSIDESSMHLSMTRALAAGGISILAEEGPVQMYAVTGVRAAGTHGSVSRTAGTVTSGLLSGSAGVTADVGLEETVEYKSTVPFLGIFWRMQFPSRAEVWFLGGAGAGNGRYAYLKTGLSGGGFSVMREDAKLSRREAFGSIGFSFPVLDNDVRLFASVYADSATNKFATQFSQVGPGSFDFTSYFLNQTIAQTQRGYTETSAGLRMGVEIRL